MSLRENEWFIQAPWGRICILAWGNSTNPPVLLCHGGMDSAASFRKLVQTLPRNFYYVGMELPGCGLSDRLPPGLMINAYDLVYCIDAVVRHFRWDTFVLIGHSMGAYISKFYNASCPGKVSKLIELDPINFIGVPPEMFAKWYETCYVGYYKNIEIYNAPTGSSRKIPLSKALESVMKKRGLSQQDATEILRRLSKPAGNGFIRFTFDQRIKIVTPVAFSPEYIRAIFTSIETPTLGIISKQSYEKGLYVNTDFLIEEDSYPARNYKCVKVDGNHDVHIVNAELVGSYVSQFLLHGLDSLDSKAKL